MPFDPAQPADHSTLSSQVMRSQLNGLNDFIATIPVGPQGPQGIPGNDGTPGAQGPAGMNGEVTNAALASAIAGTSNNTNAVALLSLTVSDPPTQAEMQSLANKLDELTGALRR